jgi:syntaxin-binding protein 1
MAAMTMNPGNAPVNGNGTADAGRGKLEKKSKYKEDGGEKEKKKRHFFGSKK